jgi:hypothetical protein
MNELDYNKILLKNLWWLALIILVALWFHFDLNFNAAFPLENATMLKGRLITNGEGSNIIHDNYSLPVFTLLYSFGGLIISRISSLILSFLMLFFFYKFTYRLLQDKLASIFAVIFLAILAPIIFISKFASVDILSLTFFTIFLMISSEIITIEDRKKRVPFVNIQKQYFCPIMASLFLALAIFSNYILILFIIPAIVILFFNDKKSAIYFTLSSIILIMIIYFLNSKLINHQLSSIPLISHESIKFSKLLVRIAEYIAIPIMISYSALQILWKTNIKSSWIYTLLLLSLIIPLYIIIAYDVFNIYRFISFSLILLAPLCGLVISKFIMINPNYKYATIFILFFIVVLSYWHLTKLENAYPDTTEITKYCEDNFDNNSIVYSEDPFLLSNHFYPKMNINNFKNIYFTNTKNLSVNDNKEFIINQIDNGMFDYVILNGLFHKEFSELLKDKYLNHKYSKLMKTEIKINSLMYPITEEENYFEIYKIDLEYKLLRKFLAKKSN